MSTSPKRITILNLMVCDTLSRNCVNLLSKLSKEEKINWVKHLPITLLMARFCVNRDIHFSPFEMVYGYKLEIQELPKRLKLVKPAGVPMGEKITPELKNICNHAEQEAKCACEQVVD